MTPAPIPRARLPGTASPLPPAFCVTHPAQPTPPFLTQELRESEIFATSHDEEEDSQALQVAWGAVFCCVGMHAMVVMA